MDTSIYSPMTHSIPVLTAVWCRLVTSLPLVRAQYRPTFWCWESRLQSILAACVRDLAIPRIHYTRTIRSVELSEDVMKTKYCP